MSEAVLILQRAVAAYGAQVRLFTRKFEKAADGSDEARAAQHNIDQCKVRVLDIEAALRTLGAPYEPLPDRPPDGGLSDLRSGGLERGGLSPPADGRGLEAKELDLREGAGGVARDAPAGSGGSLGDAQNEGAT
jgi:hypothetical protein